MSIRSLIVAAAVAISVPAVVTLAPADGNSGPIAAANLASAPANGPFLTNQWANANLSPTAAGGRHANSRKSGTSRIVAKSLSSLPIPGVYKTTPYACIVIVPGKNPDDHCVVRPSENGDAMPAIKPDLRFVPLSSK
jgi:hypothetical protein